MKHGDVPSLTARSQHLEEDIADLRVLQVRALRNLVEGSSTGPSLAKPTDTICPGPFIL